MLKNYRYDTNELDNPDIKLAFICVKNLNKDYKYVDKIETTRYDCLYDDFNELLLC